MHKQLYWEHTWQQWSVTIFALTTRFTQDVWILRSTLLASGARADQDDQITSSIQPSILNYWLLKVIKSPMWIYIYIYIYACVSLPLSWHTSIFETSHELFTPWWLSDFRNSLFRYVQTSFTHPMEWYRLGNVVEMMYCLLHVLSKRLVAMETQ